MSMVFLTLHVSTSDIIPPTTRSAVNVMFCVCIIDFHIIVVIDKNFTKIFFFFLNIKSYK